MKKIVLLISLPILVFSLSNFKEIPKESESIVITSGGAMVTFAGKRNGEILKTTALTTTELFAKYPKDGKVLSFKMVVSSGDKVIEYAAKGNKLTSEMRSQIKQTEKGKKIVFSKILVEWREGKSIPAPGISLKLI
jgi:hypothetical protein|tara:strand:+ start:427 stop:834 length:408 start_codon:yes stop_codon:yes gene_type:complete